MRTFILGVGAQKAGTTWLFKQLIKSPRYAGGFCKEYHLFDALYIGDRNTLINGARNRVSNYPSPEGEDFVERHVELMMNFYEDPSTYYDYFDSIIRSKNGFSLDITPSYSALDVAALREIRRQFLSRNIAVKVVFLMREPVTRLESAIKMNLRRKKALEGADNQEVAAKMRGLIESQFNNTRSDYAATCGNIDDAFPESDVFYGFYETLFSQAEIERLGEFLDLPADLFNVSQVVNRTVKRFKYSAADITALRECVQNRYDYVGERFGFDLSIWDSALGELVDHDAP